MNLPVSLCSTTHVKRMGETPCHYFAAPVEGPNASIHKKNE